MKTARQFLASMESLNFCNACKRVVEMHKKELPKDCSLVTARQVRKFRRGEGLAYLYR